MLKLSAQLSHIAKLIKLGSVHTEAHVFIFFAILQNKRLLCLNTVPE